MRLSGIFLEDHEEIPMGPLTLIRCLGCGLVQLEESYNMRMLYGGTYGYRSSLNGSMRRHLQTIADRFTQHLKKNDVVLDIGSNDGTLLGSFWGGKDPLCIGMDPTAAKFSKPPLSKYPEDAVVLPYFFSKAAYESVCKRKAKIVTSIAMFYDLPDPVKFAQEVAAVLAKDGFWYTEQLHLDAMLKSLSYDAICHEHLEYYSLRDIEYIAGRAGLAIVDVTFNDTNGGSIGVTLQHKDPTKPPREWKERRQELGQFAQKVRAHPQELRKVLLQCPRIVGFGASTKGNILLQHCSLGPKQVLAVADVNHEKWGKKTATGIPIMSDQDAEKLDPTHYLVLPWHFRDDILERYKGSGRKFIFPLPEPEIVSA